MGDYLETVATLSGLSDVETFLRETFGEGVDIATVNAGITRHWEALAAKGLGRIERKTP
jgi:hypothetical protein